MSVIVAKTGPGRRCGELETASFVPWMRLVVITPHPSQPAENIKDISISTTVKRGYSRYWNVCTSKCVCVCASVRTSMRVCAREGVNFLVKTRSVE